MLSPETFFDLSKTKHQSIFDGVELVWDVINKIHNYILENLNPQIKGEVMPGAWVDKNVFIDEGTVVEPGAMVKGPAIIGKNCQIRNGAYIRGDLIAGDNAVMGNSCEFKNVFLFDGANIPHLSYVGDSVIGFKSHLGAGAKIANTKLIRENVKVEIDGKIHDTGLLKFGVILGDTSDIGCNAVINPGSIIGKNSIIYANVTWRGYLPAKRIVKLQQSQSVVERRS